MKKLFAALLAAALLAAALLAAPVTPALASGGPDSRSADPATCAHRFEVSVIRQATCSMKGLLAYTCARCGLTYTAETLPDAAAHDYALTDSTATCTEPGENVYTCARCGDTYAEPAPAAGHTPSAPAATCTDGVFCTVCGQMLERPTGHRFAYQYDARFGDDGALVDYGTWRCDACGSVMAATRGNAEHYYGLDQPADAPADSSGTDLIPVGEAYDDTSATDVAPPPAVADPAAEAAAADSAAGPGQRPALWIAISAVALVVIVAEVVLLVRSLKKSKTPLD